MGASIPFAYCSCYRFIYLVISSAVFYFSSCSDKVIFFVRDVFWGQVIISPQIFLRTIKIYSKSTTTLLESFQEKRYFFSNVKWNLLLQYKFYKINKDANLYYKTYFSIWKFDLIYFFVSFEMRYNVLGGYVFTDSGT